VPRYRAGPSRDPAFIVIKPLAADGQADAVVSPVSGEASAVSVSSAGSTTSSEAPRSRPIAEDERERLFTPFHTTKPEGMGMGLNICRSIVEYHDGHLEVADNPGGGTVMSFVLPVGAVREQVA